MVMQKILGFLSLTAALALMALPAGAQYMYPASYVNIHGNASSINLSNGYYDYYGYYNNYNSSSADGGGGGANVRFIARNGFMFDATFNSDKADIGDGNMRINQGTAGLGYLAYLRSGATWYAEAMYTTFQPRLTSNYLCGGSCGTVTYNGGGVKGGFMWPFAGRWYATLDAGVAGLHGPSGTNSITQGILGGAVGYKFTPNFGVNLGILSNAWVNGNSNYDDNSSTISVTSFQAGLSLHF
jgi:hypothetical protein